MGRTMVAFVGAVLLTSWGMAAPTVLLAAGTEESRSILDSAPARRDLRCAPRFWILD